MRSQKEAREQDYENVYIINAGSCSDNFDKENCEDNGSVESEIVMMFMDFITFNEHHGSDSNDNRIDNDYSDNYDDDDDDHDNSNYNKCDDNGDDSSNSNSGRVIVVVDNHNNNDNPNNGNNDNDKHDSSVTNENTDNNSNDNKIVTIRMR